MRTSNEENECNGRLIILGFLVAMKPVVVQSQETAGQVVSRGKSSVLE